MEAFQEDKAHPLQAWQADFFWKLASKRKVARAAGHGVGKSYCLGRAAWWVMICQKNLNAPLKIPCTGPSGSNIEDVLWAEIQAAYGQLHPFLQKEFVVQKDKAFHVSKLDIGGTDSELDDGDAWFARLRTARKENPEALQGFHGDPSLFIVDEAAGVPDEVFNVMRGAMAGENVYGIMFANPRRLTGYFYNAFHSKKSMWDTAHISCEDNTVSHQRTYFYYDYLGMRRDVTTRGRVSHSYIEEMKEEYGENSPTYAFRVQGQFPRSEEDSLISPEWIKGAVDRASEMSDYDKRKTPRYMGVDVAYTGADWSAIVVRCGSEIEHMEMWQGNDPVESSRRVQACYKDLADSGMKVKQIFVDDLGVGAGVTATLRDLKLPAIPVVVSESCPELGGTRCHRMRDWLWWQCRLFFQRKRPAFAHPKGHAFERLVDELRLPNYSRSKSNGAITVETKDEMKKRIKRSPDVADALCLTFFRDDMGKISKDKSASEIRRMQKEKARKRRQRKRKKGANRWKVV